MKDVQIGKYTIKLPASRIARLALGVALILGGMLWFLPVLGFWMLPLGIAVLAVDVPALRPVADKINGWIIGLINRFTRKK